MIRIWGTKESEPAAFLPLISQPFPVEKIGIVRIEEWEQENASELRNRNLKNNKNVWITRTESEAKRMKGVEIKHRKATKRRILASRRGVSWPFLLLFIIIIFLFYLQRLLKKFYRISFECDAINRLRFDFLINKGKYYDFISYFLLYQSTTHMQLIRTIIFYFLFYPYTFNEIQFFYS